MNCDPNGVHGFDGHPNVDANRLSSGVVESCTLSRVFFCERAIDRSVFEDSSFNPSSEARNVIALSIRCAREISLLSSSTDELRERARASACIMSAAFIKPYETGCADGGAVAMLMLLLELDGREIIV